jgi:hypothetical protein
MNSTGYLHSCTKAAWGVNWDEVYIARDLMQNFFDANRGCLDEVLVKTQGYHVAVAAPTPFNLERLFYFGSEKSAEDVGQYGEGFKVAATCLLRDHAVTPVAVSGHDVVCLRVAEQAIARTTPALFGLFSLVCVMAYRLTAVTALGVQSTAWYRKEEVTFSDVLAFVRRALWAGKYFNQSPVRVSR